MRSESEEVSGDERKIVREDAALFAVSKKINADVHQIAPVGAPISAATSELVSESRFKVPYSTVMNSTSNIGVNAAIMNDVIDDAGMFIRDDAQQVSKRPDRQSIQTTHSAYWPAVPAEPSLATQVTNTAYAGY